VKEFDIWDAIAIAVALLLFIYSFEVFALPDPAKIETRCCVPVVRDANGKIARRADVLVAFQQIHPCPSTGLTTGACPNWYKDHVIPLACGGTDTIPNLQWLPGPIKNAAGVYPKDRWERKINCLPREIVK
jgi:hypothetical protein